MLRLLLWSLLLLLREASESILILEGTCPTADYIDEKVQHIEARLDTLHDQEADMCGAIFEQKNICQAIVAGSWLGSIEPTSNMAIAAIQTMHNTATQINRVAEKNNRLEARLDFLEFLIRHPPPGGIFNSNTSENNNNNNHT